MCALFNTWPLPLRPVSSPATFALREYVVAMRRAQVFLTDTSRPRASRIELANVWTRAAWELWGHREACLTRARRSP